MDNFSFNKLVSVFSVESLFGERSTKNHILKNVTFHGQQHHHEDEPPVRRCDLVAPKNILLTICCKLLDNINLNMIFDDKLAPEE